MDEFLYDYDYNYTEVNMTPHEEPVSQPRAPCQHFPCVLLLVVSVVIFLLGFCGNALVIWISGFRMRKSVNTTWYLSLAISDFIFCVFLPFSIANTAMENWVFGLFMCKFVSFVLFLNMFSSIFLLVVISIDRCISVVHPVWAQNHRTVNKASVVVVLSWVLAIALSLPSVLFRDSQSYIERTICFNKYPDVNTHKAVAYGRFLAGFAAPFTIIVVCYSIIISKLRTNRMTKSSKPFKVMTALVATFFICWLPYHVFVLLELQKEHHNHDVLTHGLAIAVALAAANSFLNPVLYVFMGNDFKQKVRRSVLSKMENAMAEDGRTTSRYLSRSSSVDARASTHI
ncbi:chemokine-like receptor 1 [Neosynchiropus ocellatus]